MFQYNVYFEIYGKKMRTTVYANNEQEAKYAVRAKIKFHAIIEKPTSNSGPEEDIRELLDILFNIKKK